MHLTSAPSHLLPSVLSRGTLIAACLLAACSVPPTTILVRVESDLAYAPGPLERVSLRVSYDGGSDIQPLRNYALGSGGAGLPGEFVVRAANPDDARPIRVEVMGHLTDGRSIRRTFTVRFSPRRTALLEVFLAQRCLEGITCPSDTTCGRDGLCEPIDRRSLPDYMPPVTGDASRTPTDAEVFNDLGKDAATDAEPAVDADDASTDAEIPTDDASDSSLANDGTDYDAEDAASPDEDAAMIDDLGGPSDAMIAADGEDVADAVASDVECRDAAECTLSGAVSACVDGRCAVMSCISSRADCDRDPATGCEASLESTVNCGACGRSCGAPPQGTATCQSGACGVSCNAGRADCNRLVADGCEVNLTTSDQHCGVCNRACGAGTACNAGTCRSICTAPAIFCDGRCVQPATDSSHCGRCGNACGGGMVCSSGSCQCPAGQTSCGGTCRSLTDDANCGACGTVCRSPPPTQCTAVSSGSAYRCCTSAGNRCLSGSGCSSCAVGTVCVRWSATPFDMCTCCRP